MGCGGLLRSGVGFRLRQPVGMGAHGHKDFITILVASYLPTTVTRPFPSLAAPLCSLCSHASLGHILACAFAPAQQLLFDYWLQALRRWAALNKSSPGVCARAC